MVGNPDNYAHCIALNYYPHLKTNKKNYVRIFFTCCETQNFEFFKKTFLSLEKEEQLVFCLLVCFLFFLCLTSTYCLVIISFFRKVILICFKISVYPFKKGSKFLSSLNPALLFLFFPHVLAILFSSSGQKLLFKTLNFVFGLGAFFLVNLNQECLFFVEFSKLCINLMNWSFYILFHLPLFGEPLSQIVEFLSSPYFLDVLKNLIRNASETHFHIPSSSRIVSVYKPNLGKLLEQVGQAVIQLWVTTVAGAIVVTLGGKSIATN